MSGKSVKIQKKIIRRQGNKFRQQGMEQLVEFIKSLNLYQRVILCWDIIRKKNLGV